MVNDRDELVEISGRVTESSVYDYRGLRNIHISNKTNPSGNTTAEYRYLYLQNSQPAFKYNVSDNYYDVFVYEGSKRIARVRINAMGTAAKEIFVNDYQGSPVAVIDDAQVIKFQNYQDPWGNMEMSVGVPSSNPEFKYTDKELDEDSGLYYFQARYYDPMGGRFFGRDNSKIENTKTNHFLVNQFLFCANNPIHYIDNDGNIFKLSGDDTFKKSTIRELNNLTGGGVDYDSKTGLVNFSSSKAVTKYANSINLINKLVASKKTITIEKYAGGNINATCAPLDVAAAADGTGSDSVVKFDADMDFYHGFDVFYTFSSNTPGQVIKKGMPRYLVIGHELVHSLHNAEGSRDSGFDTYKSTVKGVPEEYYKKEEFRTVGLGSYIKTGDINENNLRGEHGYQPRLRYQTN